ncbi:hypothetical protein FKM82_023352 [Ascaphus truei]
MKLSMSLLVLLLVPALTSGDANTCTLSDLLSLSTLLKSLASMILENAKIVCTDAPGKGAYASCPAGKWCQQNRTTRKTLIVK